MPPTDLRLPSMMTAMCFGRAGEDEEEEGAAVAGGVEDDEAVRKPLTHA